MIHITRTPSKQFAVVTTGKNGEVLSRTEEEKSKASIWKDIFAQANNFNASRPFLVQDDTAAKPIVYEVFSTSNDLFKTTFIKAVCLRANVLVPVYIPGKNKKPVKKK